MKKKHGGFRQNAGAKPLKINWKIAEKLAQENYNQQEIAAKLGVHRSTLRARCLSDNKCDFKTWNKKYKSFDKPKPKGKK